MTDPIRPDAEPPADEAAPAPVPGAIEAATREEPAASDEPVDDPALAALVAADSADAGTVTEPVMTPEPPSAPPPAAPPVQPAPPAAPAAAVAAPAPVIVQQSVVSTPRRRSGLSIARRVIAFLFGILQALLIVRIVLLLLNADPDNDIVSSILSITQPFVDPFMGIFQLDSVTGGNGSVLDIAAIVALVAWTLIETLIVSLLRLFDRPAR